jgi:O-succinylbenzoic acid--CoA ligase
MIELYDLDIPDNDAPALHWFNDTEAAETRSFASYRTQSSKAAAHLVASGLRRGDCVAIVAASSPRFAVILLACLRAGLVAVPLSPRFPIGTMVELLRLTNARILLHDDITRQASIDAARVAGVPALNFDDEEFFTASNHDSDDEFHSSQHLWQNFDGQNISQDSALNNEATILCTSGSTGVPKAFVHTLGNHYFSALGSAANIPFGQGDCWLASLPMYHVGGYAIFFRALVGGASVAFPSYQSFDVKRLVQTLERFPITHCSFVATQLFHALRDEAAVKRLQNLRAIMLGGGAIPETLIRASLERGLRIYTSYGCTEMASQVTTSPSFEAEEVRTSGKVLTFREIRIAEDAEILVRGATLAKGRLGQSGRESITDAEGWFHTKDLGKLSAEGRLTVIGRQDNMFISGGENIHPEAIEQALSLHTSVVQAIVVPVPSDEYGERPVAFVQFADSGAMTAERMKELRQLAESKLPRFAVPDAFLLFPPDAIAGGLKPSRAALKRVAEELVSDAHKSISLQRRD